MNKKNIGEIQKVLARHMHGTVFGIEYKGIQVGMIRDGSMGTILTFRSFEEIEVPIPKELDGIELEKLRSICVSTISIAETPIAQIKKYFREKDEGEEDEKL